MPVSLVRFENKNELVNSLNNQIADLADDAIQNKGSFLFGISGGSILELITPEKFQNPKFWKICLIDERYVAADSEQSNVHELINKSLADHHDLAENVIRINTELEISQCANVYKKQLTEEIKKNHDSIDLILMGVGEDGHIASLFPDHPALSVKKEDILVIENSPKPPPRRITFSMPLLLKSKSIIIALCGEKKKYIMQRILDKDISIPAGQLFNSHYNCRILYSP